MIHCSSCGQVIPDQSNFCPSCGATIPIVIDKTGESIKTEPANDERVIGTAKRRYTTGKTFNEFFRDAGTWGALLVLAGFFLPFFTMNGSSLFNSIQASASAEPAVLLWLVFPITALVVLLNSLITGWPRIITTMFIILALLALILFAYIMIKEPVKYFGYTNISDIIKIAGIGLWATLLGTILLLFHKRHRKVEVHKTKNY